MSEDRIPSPSFTSDTYSKKAEACEEPKSGPENSRSSNRIYSNVDNGDNEENDEEFLGHDDANDTNAEEPVPGLNHTLGISGSITTDQNYEDENVNDLSVEYEGGGGRNGGRSNMGDVMTLNGPDNNNEMRNYHNIDYGNDNFHGNNDDQNDNNTLYEDNFNFGDDGLQIVVNGNDTNFFV